MGITELSNILGIDKSVVSRLVKKGMPTTSVDAAQEWRNTNAPPRAKRGQRGVPPPAPQPAPRPAAQPAQPAQKVSNDATPPPPAHDSPEPDDDDNTPRQSLRRARLAEKVGYNELALCKRNGGSIEDMRKATATYVTARNNRFKAERDFKDWQRQESILLYFDEARDIASRPHNAVAQILQVAPKTLAPRLHGQPQKAIESALVEWIDKLTKMLRESI